MWILISLVVVAVVSVAAVPRLLHALAGRRGESDREASDVANQALAFSDAFRGTSSSEYPAWDQSIELAGPTQDGAA